MLSPNSLKYKYTCMQSEVNNNNRTWRGVSRAFLSAAVRRMGEGTAGVAARGVAGVGDGPEEGYSKDLKFRFNPLTHGRFSDPYFKVL